MYQHTIVKGVEKESHFEKKTKQLSPSGLQLTGTLLARLPELWLG